MHEIMYILAIVDLCPEPGKNFIVVIHKKEIQTSEVERRSYSVTY